MKKFKEVQTLILQNWKVLVGFEILYKFASALVFIPLLWGIFDWIMKASGFSYLTLENIVEFLTKPLTLLLLLFLFILATTYAMIDISAVVFVLDQSKQKQSVHIWQVLCFAVRNAVRVWNPKNLLLIFVVLLLMPFLNMGMASGVLGTLSIPEFILDYIRANALLSILLTVVTLFLTILMLRWLYAFHYFTLEGCSFGEARRRSRLLDGKKRFRDFITLLLLQFACAFLYLLLLLFFIALAVFIGKVFSSVFVLKWVSSTMLWMVIVFFILIAWALSMPISYSCISVLFYRHKEHAQEAICHSEAPPYDMEERRIRRIHRVNLLLGCIVVGLSFFLGFFLCSSYLKPEMEYVRTMEVTAHRGASAFYPENTMAAFYGAKKLGADWIELDVQQTKDGQIAVIHDPSLQRTAGVSAFVRDLSYQEIAVLDAGSFFDSSFAGEKIPLLSEVAQFAKNNGIKLNIELKPVGHETDFEKQVIEVIRQTGIEDSCVITSQVYEVLETVKAYDPTIPTVYVMSLAYGDINQLIAADHFSIEATSATRNLISSVHNAGKQIFVWTVNTRDSITKMIELDVDNIITDDIELAKQCISESRYSNLLVEYLKWFE